MSAQSSTELKETATAYQADTLFPKLRDPRYPVHRVADQLEPYLRIIVERIRPEKIILFGSFAYGQPDGHSDFDLLVVRRRITAESESDSEIRRLFGEVPCRRPPFAIPTRTPERLAERLQRRTPFCEGIVNRGLEPYVAPQTL